MPFTKNAKATPTYFRDRSGALGLRKEMLRQASVADIPAMHQVRMAVHENQLRSSAITEADYVPAIEKTGRGWVVEFEGQVVAFAVGNKTNGNIWALFVHPAHERKGYGRQLHDEMINWLRGQGLTALWLTTEPGTRAERFYEKAGWKRSGVTAKGEVRFEYTRIMTKLLRIYTVAIFLLLVLPSSSIIAQQDTTSTIKRLEEDMNSAFNRYDAETLTRLWSEDLQFIRLNGTVATKAERLAGLESPPARVPVSTIESIDVIPYRDVAVAIVVSKWTSADPEQPFSVLYRATHVWALESEQWKLVTAHVSRITE